MQLLHANVEIVSLIGFASLCFFYVDDHEA